MDYKATNWKKGSKVTSKALNNIEAGITGLTEAISAIPTLTGEPVAVEPVSEGADVACLGKKLNEVIEALKARGVLA